MFLWWLTPLLLHPSDFASISHWLARHHARSLVKSRCDKGCMYQSTNCRLQDEGAQNPHLWRRHIWMHGPLTRRVRIWARRLRLGSLSTAWPPTSSTTSYSYRRSSWRRWAALSLSVSIFIQNQNVRSRNAVNATWTILGFSSFFNNAYPWISLNS